MKYILLLSLWCAATSFVPTANADDIVGVWKNGTGKGHIQIYRQSGKFYGKIIWLRDHLDRTGKPKVDHLNSDPRERNKPLMGLVMLKDFQFDEGEWSGGRIYNPGDGREYKALIRLKDSRTLAVRGFIGFSALGKTDTWTRVK